MNRFACNLYKKTIFRKTLVDDNCIIGYDEPMKTFFFQSGREDENGTPILWLGTSFREYHSVLQIKKALKRHKFQLKILPEDEKALNKF